MTYALVTLYNPDIKVVENVRRIAKQVRFVYLYDNSEMDYGYLFENEDNVIYFHSLKNVGIPMAFNRILKKNNFQENDYICFFDQDSYIADKQIETLLEFYRKLTEAGMKVGAIGPAYFNKSSGHYEIPRIKKRINDNCYEVESIITSSMVCRYAVLKEIGFWSETLFLDCADWDLCWRLKVQKYITVLVTGVPFQHVVGNGQKKIGCVAIRKSTEIRSYYRTRDQLYLINERYTPVRNKIRMIVDVIFGNAMKIIFLENKRLRYMYIRRGVNDYRKGIHGEFRKNE